MLSILRHRPGKRPRSTNEENDSNAEVQLPEGSPSVQSFAPAVMTLQTKSMDDLPEDALKIIAGAVSPTALFAMLQLSKRYTTIVTLRVHQLAVLQNPPFNLSPSVILGFKDRPIVDLVMRNIGDKGLEALSGSLAMGAMTQCTTLNLARNRIGDKGLEAFSAALAIGAMAQLQVSWLLTALSSSLDT